MIKTDKKIMIEELVNKEKIIEMRIKSFEKQEQVFSGKLEALQREILK